MVAVSSCPQVVPALHLSTPPSCVSWSWGVHACEAEFPAQQFDASSSRPTHPLLMQALGTSVWHPEAIEISQCSFLNV